MYRFQDYKDNTLNTCCVCFYVSFKLYVYLTTEWRSFLCLIFAHNLRSYRDLEYTRQFIDVIELFLVELSIYHMSKFDAKYLDKARQRIHK